MVINTETMKWNFVHVFNTTAINVTDHFSIHLQNTRGFLYDFFGTVFFFMKFPYIFIIYYFSVS